MEDADMRAACRAAQGATKYDYLDGYDARYFPPRFLCRLKQGGSYPAQVPGYVNPSLVLLSSLTIACASASWITRAKPAAHNIPEEGRAV
ncbi:hypothetical protein [Streptomyces sp. ERV7]|uniref:hypothetical protein n=1 Tax=Streptomyces sp. ERV7 TaxID=1322334 RepID=UPI00131D6891|nr:hypothetical protein [Streptomyces sp. ERV7]